MRKRAASLPPFIAVLCAAISLFSGLAMAQPSMLDPTVTQVVAGNRHTCVLTTGGGVKCWGNNQFGQLGDNSTTDRPAPVDVSGLTSGVVAVAAVGFHSCALTTAGGVKCWGYNFYGQIGDNSTTDRHVPVDVTGLASGVATLVSGGHHNCALTTGGAMKCWGNNQYGQLGDNSTTNRLTPVNVAGLAGGAVAIVAGGFHTCARSASGGVKCWGRNLEGQVGDNSTTERHTPVDVAGLAAGVAAIEADIYHTCAITTGGGAKCWGQNLYGHIGDNSTTNRLAPVDVSGLTAGVAGLAAGGGHTCALTTGGGVKCWGLNLDGQLGDNSITQHLTPVDVPGLTSGVIAIAAGGTHTCAHTTGGGVKCWGDSQFGQVGDNSFTDRLAPLDVGGAASGVAKISVGGAHTCALTTGGGAKCWGQNTVGQVGDNSQIERRTPVDVSGLTAGVSAIAAAINHGCALTTGGGVKCWGNNTDGRLGDNSTTLRLAPVDVFGLTSGVSAIAAGNAHSCALTTGGGAKCWGSNAGGQLGDNTLASTRIVPVDVFGLTSGVAAIGTGTSHTCAVTTGGGAKCWGSNVAGQLGDNTSANTRIAPVDVIGLASGVASIGGGFVHTCALTTAGGVKCWGSNGNGELGDNSTTPRLTPVDVSGLTSGVVAIAVGFDFNCALTIGGAVKCWGYNGSGQLGDNTSLTTRLAPVDVVGLSSGVAGIASGYFYTCARLVAGGIRCWGDNANGQFGNNTTTPSLVPATAILRAQSIAFTPPPSIVVGTPALLSATATSALAVTFDTWTPSACTVSGTVVTPLAAGLCGLRASQAGNANNAAAPQRLLLVPVAASALAPSATQIGFGNRELNTTSSVLVSVANAGNAALVVGSITAQGAGFSQANTCTAPVGVGGSCALTVYFRPTTEGPKTGQITIASNAPGSPHIILLGGNGVDLSNPLGDADGDGVPNGVEPTVNLDPRNKDNDIFNSPRLFAMQQYRDFLGREGDAGGIEYYITALNTQAATRVGIIENFFNSPEFQGVGSPVARLYFATYLRIPDYAGLIFQINAFRAGTPLAVIANNFTLSPEFAQRYGAVNNAQFVTLLYQNILGRTASQGEIDFHVARLTAGATRGEVLVGFSESPEYKANTANDVYVTMMYVGMLRRAPEQAGFDYWTNYMDAGNSGLALIAGFLQAPEYHNRFLP